MARKIREHGKASVLFTAGFALCLAMALSYASSSGTDSSAGIVSDTEFIVRGDIKAEDVQARIEDSGGRVESIREMGKGMFAVSVSADDTSDLRRACIDKGLDMAPNKYYSIQDATLTVSSAKKASASKSRKDPLHGDQYEFVSHYDEEYTGIGAEAARAQAAKTCQHETIAVIDSGFKMDHAELQGKMLEELAYDAVNDVVGGNVDDVCDHGTAVASIIVANKNNGVGGYGICANVDILPIRAASGDGYFSDEDIIRGLDYVEQVVASGQVDDLHVVNLSLAGWYPESWVEWLGLGDEATDPLYAKIKELYDDYGIVCVCAGGNGDENGKPHKTGRTFPADYDVCVAVTSSNQEGGNDSSCDVNSEKDLTAPGEMIVTASCNSKTAIDDVREGTSYAAPIVSASIATILQLNPSYDVDDAVRLLKQTAVPVAKASGMCWYSKSVNGSAGIVNLECAAFKALRTQGEADSCWKGMRKTVKTDGMTLTYKVTSSEKRTVAITSIKASKRYNAQLNIPKTVKMPDGRRYKVTAIFAQPMFYGDDDFRIKTIVVAANVKTLGYDSLVSENSKYNTVVIKTRKLTRKSVEDCLLGADEGLGRIVVHVSKKHSVNVKYAKRYAKLFTEKNAGAKVRRIVAA